ncbi:hypothetical protein JRO89_XS11G0077600 [Xanthoceras sorbifolium]|uniref:Major facilitator superfamily (MFS) profile domain-containing protein n=1 Tax=Xanthoceras sorbifolium TaxID=99658 RepID=A0ABQ8HF82_9ROSI|nr:hypothetical protein JRO89_XS11G0077600 [Xanthoceras sorbifolium]
MAENTSGLLQKNYYENCPGCKMDRLKEEQSGVPYKNLSYIWLVSLCTGLLPFPFNTLNFFANIIIVSICLLHGYRNYILKKEILIVSYVDVHICILQIRDFHIAKREEDIGYYAGFVGSSFMVGRALTSILWGVVADRYGRKPIIFIGTFSVVVFNALFGLSTSFWMALSMRFLLGCFNSLLGTIRAYASEVCRDEYQALALSIVSTSRGIGLIIGPAIGGFFAQDLVHCSFVLVLQYHNSVILSHERYPTVFSESSIFGRFPYFLPCLIISIYAVGVLIACWWLPGAVEGSGGFASEGSGKVLGAAEDLGVEVDLDVVLSGGFVGEGSGADDIQGKDNVGGDGVVEGGGGGTGTADKDAVVEGGVGSLPITSQLTFSPSLCQPFVASYKASIHIHMQETMHMHDKKLDERHDACDRWVASSNASGMEDVVEAEERKTYQKPNLFKNWPLMSTIIVYCVFSLQEIAYSEVSFFPFSYLEQSSPIYISKMMSNRKLTSSRNNQDSHAKCLFDK